MDKERKRQLQEEYKNRRPEMGVICFRCIETGESFLDISTDTKADFNSLCFKLSCGGYPNKQLQELWKQYGEKGFELSVKKVLKYEDPKADHQSELNKLLIQCMEGDTLIKRIWK